MSQAKMDGINKGFEFLEAAEQRLKQNLYMVDAVMYATALHLGSKLLTGDKRFAKLESAEFLS